jgi:D-3-phosphoglycerate dehydrogenase / 2-oxoglutarate reductase
MRKLLVYFENHVFPPAEALLAQHADVQVHHLRYDASASDNWRLMSQAHGYQIAPRSELQEPWFGDARLLLRCPSMLAICSTGAGFDMVDLDACAEAGVLVCNQSGSNHEAVAEHALGMMLGLAKKITLANRAMRQSDGINRWEYVGSELKAKVLGIVGLGTIGTRTAELGRALGMEVIACDPYVGEAQVAQRGALKVGMAELLRRSDFVSVHCPLTAETVNLFGAAEFLAMKRTAYFINTARGGTYDEGALLDALSADRIAGAGVDVFLQEPPPSHHPLLLHPAVIATPHTAGATQEAMRDMARFAAEQWLDIFQGRRPPRLQNKHAWPRYCMRFERLFGFRPQEHPV